MTEAPNTTPTAAANDSLTAPPSHQEAKSVSPPASNEPAAKSWVDSLPEELRSEASLKKFSGPDALAKSYLHLERTARGEKMPLPNQHWTDDDWKQLYTKIGLPESIDKYEVKAPEGANAEFLSKMKEAAYKAGVLPKQFQGLLETMTSMTQEQIKAKELAESTAKAERLDALKKEWSQGWDKEVYTARLAVEEFGGDELRKILDSKGLSNDPDMIKLFNKIGKSLSEEKISRSETTRHFGKTNEEINQEINKLRVDKSYLDASHPNHEAVVQQVYKLYEALASSGMNQ